MKRLKQGPMKQFRRRKCKLRNHVTSKEGQFKRKCILRNHKTLKEGATRRKTTENSRTIIGGGYSSNNSFHKLPTCTSKFL
jgi:hypothetical protein